MNDTTHDEQAILNRVFDGDSLRIVIDSASNEATLAEDFLGDTTYDKQAILNRIIGTNTLKFKLV